MNNRIYTILSFVLLLAVGANCQSSRYHIYHPFTGTLVLSLDGGATAGLTDYSTMVPDYMVRSSLEYYFPLYAKSAFGIRGSIGTGYLSGKDPSLTPKEHRTDLLYGSITAIYLLSLGEVVFPYASGGATYLFFNPKGDKGALLPNNQAGIYSKQEIDLTGETGLRFLLADNLTLNLGAGILISQRDYLDDLLKGTNKDLIPYATLGFSYAFFGDTDDDHDGIVNANDDCPETPRGIKTDAKGCPEDSDGDGIPDFADQCPDTPAKVKVNKKGCPADSDNDGVADYLDLCAGTLTGVSVDAYGCPKDTDEDGVADFADECPGTPKGVTVTAKGCPTDADNDGVADYRDRCPNTPIGTAVDEVGCPLPEPTPTKTELPAPQTPTVKDYVPAEITLGAAMSFKTGSSELLPSAYDELDRILDVVLRYPATHWSIEGHTDATGKEEKNKRLSLQRANAVLEYFVLKGATRNRFTVKGWGSAFPVADNGTDEGRKKNRRVVIVRQD